MCDGEFFFFELVVPGSHVIAEILLFRSSIASITTHFYPQGEQFFLGGFVDGEDVVDGGADRGVEVGEDFFG